MVSKKINGILKCENITLKPHSTHSSTTVYHKEMRTHSVCSDNHTDIAAQLDITTNNSHHTSYSTHT